MMDVSRQQRRKEAREQAKLGSRLLATGLQAEPKRIEVLAVTRVVAAKLAELNNPARAGEAAGLAHDLCEASLKIKPASVAIACRAGCSYCCHQFVGALAPEVFRLARAVRSGHSPGLDAASVIARCQPLKGLGPGERVGRKLPCPLLVDGRCGTYAQRPLVCRQTTSLDLDACIEEFNGQNMSEQIAVSSPHLAHAGTAHVVLLGALRSVGLSDAAFELSAALEVALSDADCEQRWLAGENVFGGLAEPIPVPPRVNFVAGQIAQALT